MSKGINSLKVILNPFEPVFYMLLSLKNIAENFLIKIMEFSLTL